MVSLTVLGTAACKKDDDNPGPIGGKGGHATIRAYAQHHKPPSLDSMKIFIKYNASELPASLVFDDSMKVVKTAADTVAIFTNLKPGKYYLYGDGWDPKIGQEVKGGIPYTIARDSTTTSVLVPVTEGD